MTYDDMRLDEYEDRLWRELCQREVRDELTTTEVALMLIAVQLKKYTNSLENKPA